MHWFAGALVLVLVVAAVGVLVWETLPIDRHRRIAIAWTVCGAAAVSALLVTMLILRLIPAPQVTAPGRTRCRPTCARRRRPRASGGRTRRSRRTSRC